jgi:tRNA(adenine34) deaminase
MDLDFSKHREYMARAIVLAREAGELGEVPVGAIVVGENGDILAVAANRKQRDRDATAHAEILAIRAASQKLGNWHLDRCTLYVTLEPCPMCAGAIIGARLKTLVYGADDAKTGAVRTVLNLPDSPASNHKLDVVGGILADVCQQQLSDWFDRLRIKN